MLLYTGDSAHLAVELFKGRVRVSYDVGNYPVSNMFRWAGKPFVSLQHAQVYSSICSSDALFLLDTSPEGLAMAEESLQCLLLKLLPGLG